MRNRLIKLILLPVAMFIWLIGWTMTWASTRKEQETQQTRHKALTEKQSITIMPIIPEEPEQCEA
jgi:hypothetical protein